jgi:Polyketide cyclase / dehydrase and lipid transport
LRGRCAHPLQHELTHGMSKMVERIHREFTVDVPLPVAWQHLANVEHWPSWAKHIKRVTLIPPGELTATSSGTFYLSNGIQSTFRMAEYNPPHNWQWIGPFLWLSVSYDHQFEALDSHHTKLTWRVGAEGLGEFVFGRLFAAIYNLNLSKAIPHLIAEMRMLT